MKRLLVLIMTSVLGACSTPGPLPPVSDAGQAWERHSQRMSAIDEWDIEGRIAIRSYDDAVNANLRWQQEGDRYRILLSGPFGQGAVSLRGEPGIVRLQTNEEDAVADNAETLLYQYTGLLVPIESLKYWIRGLPEPQQAGRQTLDPQGRLAGLQQDRWKVRFRAYNQVDGHQMPVKVFVDNHQLSVRIVIDKWSLPAS
ncbi:MAG: outer membrane lipoprotein LolB [Gammaproteobacteria bacterium]|nr:outer membrane lipoprotein LolB [Gammaproteobacteria bacterium]